MSASEGDPSTLGGNIVIGDIEIIVDQAEGMEQAKLAAWQDAVLFRDWLDQDFSATLGPNRHEDNGFGEDGFTFYMHDSMHKEVWNTESLSRAVEILNGGELPPTLGHLSVHGGYDWVVDVPTRCYFGVLPDVPAHLDDPAILKLIEEQTKHLDGKSFLHMQSFIGIFVRTPGVFSQISLASKTSASVDFSRSREPSNTLVVRAWRTA